MSLSSKDKPRVLIVDDQQNWREALCDMLDPRSYIIETASTYDEAREKLVQSAFHVVISDQRLVDTDPNNTQGIELLETVNSLGDGTQALIVTGYPTIEAAKRAIRGRHAFDYILKRPEKGGPFNIREYRETVQRAADSAKLERESSITLRFSLSDCFARLTYDTVSELISPGSNPEAHARLTADTKVVINRLLHPFQPLAKGLGRARVRNDDCTVDLLFWSRMIGQTGVVSIGLDHSRLRSSRSEWMNQEWSLIEEYEFTSGTVFGTSYRIENLTFEQMRDLVE